MLTTKAKAGLGLLGLALLSPAIWADTRIAYSKAADIEVFGTGSGTEWCRPQTSLRLVAGAKADTSRLSIQSFIGKVGALLQRDCPQAGSVNVKVLQNGILVATGLTAPSSGWRFSQWQGISPSASVPQTVPDATSVPQPNAQQPAPQPSQQTVQQQPMAQAIPQTVPVSPLPATDACDADCKLKALLELKNKTLPPVEASANTLDQSVSEPTLPAPAEPAATGGSSAAENCDADCKLKMLLEMKQAGAQAPQQAPEDVKVPSAKSGQPAQSAAKSDAPRISQAEMLRGKKVFEGFIRTDDKNCGLYLNTERNQSVADRMRLQVQGVGCVEGKLHGKGLVRVFDGNGRNKGNLNGYFSHGYFTGSTFNQSPFAARGSRLYLERGKLDWLAYPIKHIGETDNSFYLLYTAKGRRWSQCLTPMVKVVTEDESRFYQSEYVDQIKQASQALVDKHCPNANKFYLEVSRDLLAEDVGAKSVVYAGYFHSTAGKWKSPESLALGNNLAYAREVRRLKALKAKWQQVTATYNHLQSLKTRIERIAFVENIHITPIQVAAAESILKKQAVPVTSVVKVTDINKQMAKADWPYPVTLRVKSGYTGEDTTLPEVEGWYIITGELIGEFVTGASPKASVNLKSVKACQTGNCAEYDDLIALARRYQNMPEWRPVTFKEYYNEVLKK